MSKRELLEPGERLLREIGRKLAETREEIKRIRDEGSSLHRALSFEIGG